MDEERRILGRAGDALLTLVGWVSFLFVCPINLKLLPSEDLFLAWKLVAVACFAVTGFYLGIGRLWMNTTSRPGVRPIFQGFILGAAMIVGLALFVFSLWVTPHSFLGFQALSAAAVFAIFVLICRRLYKRFVNPAAV